MIKQLTLKFTIVLAMTIAFLSTSAADFTDGIYSFDIISEDDATVKLVKAAQPTTTNEMYIPSIVKYLDKTYTVKVIGERAIYSISGLQLAIYIPNTIEEIEPYGISSCWEMYWLEIYEGETPIKVGRGVLNSCSKLEYADIRRQIVYADDVSNYMKMFYGKKQMYGVMLQGSYTEVNDYEFAYCAKLEFVSTGPNIVKIGNHAFDGCTNFTVGIFDFENVEEIGDYAFANTGCTYATLPAKVKTISEGLFEKCAKLRQFNFNYDGTIESIGKYAFYGCPALESFTVPSSVNEIGARAFQGCESLISFTIEPSDSELKFVANGSNNTFFDNSPLESLTIGRNIETYVNGKSSYPFKEMTTLKSIAFNGNCTKIDGMLFVNCTGLTNINWGNTITEIEYNAFAGCTSLSGTLTLPESLVKLGTDAFLNCIGITYIDLPQNIESIGAYAFEGTSISVLNIPSRCSLIYEGAFRNCEKLNTCILQDGENEIGIGEGVFSNSPLNNLTLGRSVVSPGKITGASYAKAEYPFKGMLSLETLYITPGCKSIMSQGFYGCTNLKDK